MVKRICLVIAAFIAVQLTASAGALYKVQTRQIYCFSDIMRAYIDIEDSESSPAAKPERSAIVGYIDAAKLTASSVERFGDTDEGVADIFLVDISGSLRDEQMVRVRAAIKTWAANMKENDRIAVMTFGSGVSTPIDFSADKNAISAAVDGITNNDKNTQLYGGISQALKLAARNDADLPKRRNIILITDGVNDYSGGVSEEDVYSQLKSSLVPVYCMWMPGTNEEKGRATLNSVAEYSGGTMYDMSDKSIDTVYDRIRQSIRNTYTVDFAYGNASADNAAHTFLVRVAENDRVAEDSVVFTLTKTDEESGKYRISAADDETDDGEAENNESENNTIIVLGAAAACIASAAAAALLIMKKRNGNSYAEPPNGCAPLPYTDTNQSKTVNLDFKTGMTEANRDTGAYGVRVTLRSITGKSYSASVTDGITIGRGKACDIVLNAPTISSVHASLSLVNGKLYLDDLRSANGTLLNGRLINMPAEVKSSDIIIFGSEEYRITF